MYKLPLAGQPVFTTGESQDKEKLNIAVQKVIWPVGGQRFMPALSGIYSLPKNNFEGF
jgi:hypothetical protein